MKRGKNFMLRSAVLLPLPMLFLVPALGSNWAFAVLFYLSIFTFLVDETLTSESDEKPQAGRVARTFADLVPVVLGLAHLILLPLAVASLATAHQQPLSDTVLKFTAFSLFFGTISTANAHELIHRKGLFRRLLGTWVLISILFGHHASAHTGVHHVRVATRDDPNTARLNEGVYRYFLRAWRGSFRTGLALEVTRRQKKPRFAALITNPYCVYIAGAVMFILGVWVFFGPAGLVAYFGLALIAQSQLLLSDYVQHYGLERKKLHGGKYERVTVQHSWNAPHALSSALILNASYHSDHHVNPQKRYHDLRHRAGDGAPVLPHSIPVMSLIALFPGLWRRTMNPLVATWLARQNRAPERTPSPSSVEIGYGGCEPKTA